MDWCGKFVVLSFFHSSLICAGKTDLGLGTEEAPVKRERSEVQDEMVALFGSEKQKRAFAAYKRNKVGSEALQTALATAVTHAEASFEAVEEGKLFVHELQFAVENISPTVAPLAQGSGLAPPFNPQAEVPRDVYKINDSILSSVYYSLHPLHLLPV